LFEVLVALAVVAVVAVVAVAALPEHEVEDPEMFID
jgi:type II secretory pathway component PulJ